MQPSPKMHRALARTTSFPLLAETWSCVLHYISGDHLFRSDGVALRSFDFPVFQILYTRPSVAVRQALSCYIAHTGEVVSRGTYPHTIIQRRWKRHGIWTTSLPHTWLFATKLVSLMHECVQEDLSLYKPCERHRDNGHNRPGRRRGRLKSRRE